LNTRTVEIQVPYVVTLVIEFYMVKRLNQIYKTPETN